MIVALPGLFSYHFLIQLFGDKNCEVSIIKGYKSMISYTLKFSSDIKIVKIKGMRKDQGVPQSQTEALPRHQEEEETDKSKQAQIVQTYEKHCD